MREAGTLYWLLSDHLHSTAVTAYSGGGKKAELRYYPYGATRYASGNTPTSYKFTGRRLDEATGLYFYNACYYDPALRKTLRIVRDCAQKM